MSKELLISFLYLLAIILVSYSSITFFAKEHSKKAFIPFAIGVLFILLATYIRSPYVDFTQLGDQSTFGQFGDYIGGVLNPVFGFLTVILLIESLKQQRIANQLNASKQETKKSVKTSKKHTDKLLNEPVIRFENEEDNQSILSIYQSQYFGWSQGPRNINEKRTERWTLMKQAIMNIKNGYPLKMTLEGAIDPEFMNQILINDWKLTQTVKALISESNEYFQGSIALIKLETTDYLKQRYRRELTEVAETLCNLNIITEEERHYWINRAKT